MWDPTAQSPWSTGLGAPAIPLCGLCDPSVVIESWVILSHSCLGSALSLVNCVDQSQPQCMSCCAGVNHSQQNLPQQGLMPADISLWICHLWNILALLWCCWSWALGVLVLGHLGGTVVHTSIRHCLWLVLGNLFGAVLMWLLQILGYKTSLQLAFS